MISDFCKQKYVSFVACLEAGDRDSTKAKAASQLGNVGDISTQFGSEITPVGKDINCHLLHSEGSLSAFSGLGFHGK